MNLKRAAGRRAADFIEDGMVLGLGTGSTVYYTIERVGELVADGWDLIGVPTSESTIEVADTFGVPLTSLKEQPILDLTIDGADEVDPDLQLIKGLGAALVREKIVATCSKREIIVVDDSKLVDQLGTRAPLPVEVVTFGHTATRNGLKALGCDPVLRMQKGTDQPLRSDNDNWIYDCRFEAITDPIALEAAINALPGAITSGLFIDLTTDVIVADSNGVRHMSKDA